MKKLLSALLSVPMLVSAMSFSVFANTNEPTTEELEAIIKIVKPKLDVPEECSEFTWRFNAKNAYSPANWRLTWETVDDAEKPLRVQVSCDVDGNITNYIFRDYDKVYGRLPDYSLSSLELVADKFLEKTVPEASKNVKLYDSYGSNIYAGQYTYHYVRCIDDYLFPDNYVNISVDFNTGEVAQMSVDYNYAIDVEKHDTIITAEKAEEILGTRQKMTLEYLTKTDVNEDTKERTIKAFLVYRPATSYLAVDAFTGEIYDKKSEWTVNDSVSAGSAMDKNGAMMYDEAEAEKEEGFGDRYKLTEQELAGVNELAGLISKEAAINAVTENEYLYINPSLTAVTANLSKNNSALKTASYQNDNGSYIWNISFSNPVIEDKYYSYAYANATVNAENGEIISYTCNLNDYYYYSKNNLDIPDIKYDAEAAEKIAEEFLGKYAADKFVQTVKDNYNATNLINRIEENGQVIEKIYGAHTFGYTRVNEGIKFSRNYINVGVDGVTGKIYNYNRNWWMNVEFESPKGAITPEKALSCYISNEGYGIIYERNVTHIYNPVTASSKKDICIAFAASVIATVKNGGDLDVIIDKYAKNIDRAKLNEAIMTGDESVILEYICDYYGVSVKDVESTANEYVDTSMFYDLKATARLVYTCYDIGTMYVSPFTGKLITARGEEYKPAAVKYSYNDLEGHWIEKDVLLLADIGIGFEGGEFAPDKLITSKEFVSLAQSMSFRTSDEENDKNVTRINAIKSIVDSMGYEKIAKLKGIYKTDFADNDDIKEDDLGYVSLAFGLGIIKGDGKNVNAYEGLTRAQAVSLLINAVKAAR